MTISDSTRHARYTRCAVSLLQYSSLEDVAFICGISVRTLQRYMTDPQFQAILHSVQQEAISSAARQLAGIAADAVKVLHEIMNDASYPPGVRSRCADIALQQTGKYFEYHTLANRIQTLERNAKLKQDAQFDVS